MVQSNAGTPEAYLAGLSPDRREAVARVREVILKNLPDGYEEGMEYGMIGYYVPLKRYPDTYNGRPLCVLALASQKNHMSLYLMGAYGNPEARQQLEERFAASGKKLDMGKSCLRFKKLEDLPLETIGETISQFSPEEFIERYEASRKG